MFESAQYVADYMEVVPILVIPCIDAIHMPLNAPGLKWLSLGGAIFPAIWSFQLALRARGLGSCITTLHLAYEREISKIIGIPKPLHKLRYCQLLTLRELTLSPPTIPRFCNNTLEQLGINIKF